MKTLLIVACVYALLVSFAYSYSFAPRLWIGTFCKQTELYAGFGKQQASGSSAPTFDRCPCGSQKGYNECCGTTHILMEGKYVYILIPDVFSNSFHIVFMSSHSIHIHTVLSSIVIIHVFSTIHRRSK